MKNKPIRQKSREEREKEVWKLYENENVVESFRNKGTAIREKEKIERDGLRKLELRRDDEK